MHSGIKATDIKHEMVGHLNDHAAWVGVHYLETFTPLAAFSTLYFNLELIIPFWRNLSSFRIAIALMSSRPASNKVPTVNTIVRCLLSELALLLFA